MSFRLPASVATAAVAALLAIAAPASAQAPARPAPTSPADGYVQAISANIVAFPFGLFSAEYEHALVWPGFSFGLGGSWMSEGGLSEDSSHDRWLSAKLLYYPNEDVLRGFSLGVTAGAHSAEGDGETICSGTGECTVEEGARQTAPTLGVIANYDWLLGRAQRFRVGIGAGAKRVLKDVDAADPLLQVYPDARFVVGIAF